jgi:hypothetical protein
VYWRSVLRRQAASGASASRFCTRERLSLATFYAWRRRLRSGDDGPSAFPSATSPSALLPVRLVPDATSPGCLEVLWPSGIVLRVPPGSDEATLRRVVEAVHGVAEKPSC